MTELHICLLLFLHYIPINKTSKDYQRTALVWQYQTRWVYYIKLDLNLSNFIKFLPALVLISFLTGINFLFSLGSGVNASL